MKAIALRRLGRADIGPALGLIGAFRPDLASEAGLSAFLADGHARLWGAFAEGEPVAFAYGWELPRLDDARMLYLHEVAVAATWRGQGVGKRLLAFVLADCGRGGVGKVFLSTWQGNTAANALYRSLGGAPSPDSLGNDTVYWFHTDPDTQKEDTAHA